jgi:hypothetical protein
MELMLTLDDRAIDAIRDCIAFLRCRAGEARQQRTAIRLDNPVGDEPVPAAVTGESSLLISGRIPV